MRNMRKYEPDDEMRDWLTERRRQGRLDGSVRSQRLEAYIGYNLLGPNQQYWAKIRAKEIAALILTWPDIECRDTVLVPCTAY